MTITSPDFARRTEPRPSAHEARSIEPQRLLRAKAAYTTRYVAAKIAATPEGFGLLSGDDVVPHAGDVVLARIESIGQHPRIESPHSRRASLYVGDEVIVAYGNRYAPDQFEAEVPGDLGPAHLVAAGGVAARALGSHAVMKPATRLRPLGLLTDEDGVVTLAKYADLPLAGQPAGQPSSGRPPAIAVLGTSMNSGKTTSAAAIIRGLRAAGLRVAAGKVTGTGAGGDPYLFTDSGAIRTIDFTHFGYPSTYLLEPNEVRTLLDSLMTELEGSRPEVIVVEVADGLYQRETSTLIADSAFRTWFDRCVFASSEALGAVAGQAHLHALGLDVRLVTGVLTSSPLATREAFAALHLPVLGLGELESASIVEHLVPELADSGTGGASLAG